MDNTKKVVISSKFSNISKDLFCGIAAGTMCAFSGHPFDTIKVKMQVYPEIHNSPLNCLKNIIKNEGFFGFYRGFTPAMTCNVLENGVLFLAYPQCCKFTTYLSTNISIFNNILPKNQEYRNVSIKTIGGSFAGIFASLVISPTEMVKCRLQSLQEKKNLGQLKSDMNVFDVIKDIIKKDGKFGIFRGLIPCMIREFFGYFLIFGGYESSNFLLSPLNLGPLQYMIAGGCGGMSYWSILYPIDVIKSRIQVLRMDGHFIKYSVYCTNLYKNNGVKIFYSGITPTLIRAFVANAFLFVTYEYFKKLLFSQQNINY